MLSELKVLMVGPEECRQALDEWSEREGNALAGVILSREVPGWVLAVRDYDDAGRAWLPSGKRYDEPGNAMRALGNLLDSVERRRRGAEDWPTEEQKARRRAEVRHMEESGEHLGNIPNAGTVVEFSGG